MTRANGSSRILAALLAVYILNFLDRQILGILAAPIKADLHLTDTQFGVIGGLAFALLYSLLAVPFAWLADRTSRGGVIALALAIWSGFTALCGAAGGFWSLFLCRLGVGVGEAGGVAPSYAMIADLYPEGRRARALAIYSLGVPVGLASGTLLGAYIAARVEWRIAFVSVGVVGLLFAPLFRWLVRDAPRPASPTSQAISLRLVFPMLARKPSFWLLSFAAASSSLLGYGFALWTPSILMRSFGLDLITTGRFLGSVLLIGGSLGVLAGGWLTDRLAAADPRWHARLPAIAWAINAPLYAIALTAPSAAIAWPLLLVCQGLSILWFGPVVAGVQKLAPPPMRATASACFLLIVNLIGLGGGPLLMGRLSDALKPAHGVDALRDAAFYCLGFYVLAALLAITAARHLPRDSES